MYEGNILVIIDGQNVRYLLNFVLKTFMPWDLYIVYLWRILFLSVENFLS